jgi:hypothetical protein
MRVKLAQCKKMDNRTACLTAGNQEWTEKIDTDPAKVVSRNPVTNETRRTKLARSMNQ